MYTYIAAYFGHSSEQGAFRALTTGYNLWASGRIDQIEVNIEHPKYCHMSCSIKPSIMAGWYHLQMLLGWEGELATVCSTSCECAAGWVYSVCVNHNC